MEYQLNRRRKKTGGQEIAIITAIIGLSVALTGGFYLRNIPGPPPFVTVTTGSLCCDTGNGVDCHPQTNLPEITYNGQAYALLKSNVTNSLCGRHHRQEGNVTIGGTSYPLVIDTSNELVGECGNNNQDQLVCRDANGVKTCIPIPNDELIYVCKANCTTPPLSSCCDAAPDHYGNPQTVLDVYYRVADQNNIPPVIKDCQNCVAEDSDYHSGPNCPLKPNTAGTASGSANPQILLTPLPYPTHHSEQLHTFTFGQQPANPGEWMRSFCKPVVYLYPPQTENVQVKIAPKGKLMVTIPNYPSSGWNVTAHPDGSIDVNNTTYSYLYYEAGIADSLLPDSKKGYVESYDHLNNLFVTILPKLGLNENETKQFSDYWTKALPKSPYYFISIVPQTTLNQISPLTISPTPDSLIRVALDFEPLDKKIDVVPPTFTSVDRKGFTVVEWGGLFKKDKGHPFHCLQ